MKSNADVVYDESKGKLYLNENGTAKGWGEKKVGGLVAKFKGNPELSADNFDDVTAYGRDAITGGEDIKGQITSLGEEFGDEKMSELYGEILINPKKGLKRIVKAGKKEGYSFDKDELADALNEMDQAGAFVSVEVDDASLDALLGTGDAFSKHRHGRCWSEKQLKINNLIKIIEAHRFLYSLGHSFNLNSFGLKDDLLMPELKLLNYIYC